MNKCKKCHQKVTQESVDAGGTSNNCQHPFGTNCYHRHNIINDEIVEYTKNRKTAKNFYDYLGSRFKKDNNVWSYIEELWNDYNKKKTAEDLIDTDLEKIGLEGTFYDLQYKGWQIWSVNEIDKEAWGLFAINPKGGFIPLNTQKEEFAIEILVEELKKDEIHN